MTEDSEPKATCILCQEKIHTPRLSTTFVENGREKVAHDPCLAELEPARARDIEQV